MYIVYSCQKLISVYLRDLCNTIEEIHTYMHAYFTHDVSAIRDILLAAIPKKIAFTMHLPTGSVSRELRAEEGGGVTSPLPAITRSQTTPLNACFYKSTSWPRS